MAHTLTFASSSLEQLQVCLVTQVTFALTLSDSNENVS